MIQRLHVGANGETREDVIEQLEEEVRAFCSRHRGRKWWSVKMTVTETVSGYWGHVSLIRREDSENRGYPVRKEAIEDGTA